MEAMEAELDPPPLMKAAFARNAEARRGWELMPQTLRRPYLIFIFRGRYPETRALLAFISENLCYQCNQW
jgi:hypothetical protein